VAPGDHPSPQELVPVDLQGDHGRARVCSVFCVPQFYLLYSFSSFVLSSLHVPPALEGLDPDFYGKEVKNLEKSTDQLPCTLLILRISKAGEGSSEWYTRDDYMLTEPMGVDKSVPLDFQGGFSWLDKGFCSLLRCKLRILVGRLVMPLPEDANTAYTETLHQPKLSIRSGALAFSLSLFYTSLG
jgi:hypothetical protein